MDGKRVMIQAPLNSGTEYHNYKNFFIIVLFALVDADYNFMYTDVMNAKDGYPMVVYLKILIYTRN